MAVMRRVEILREESRNYRRTIADALEVLRELAGFGESDRAEVRVDPMRLPSGEVVGLVHVLFDAPLGDGRSIISLPPSPQFRAIIEESARQTFEISRLNGAVVDADATAVLADGTRLRAIEVIPARIPYNPSKLDWRILHSVLAMANAGHCYRSLPEGLPPHLAEQVPDVRAIDFARLYANPIKLPRLSMIERHIRRKNSDLNPSRQKIADALRTFGLHVPRRRPRARPRHAISTNRVATPQC
jgi:hypothetical protein